MRFLLSLALSFPAVALAQPMLGLEVQSSRALLEDQTQVYLSPTIGYTLSVMVADVTPEIGLGLMGENYGIQPKVGARARLGKLIKPGAYGHIISSEGLSFAPGTTGFDAGVSLDLTAIPHLEFGLMGGVLGLPENDGSPLDVKLSGGLRIAAAF